MVEVVQREEGTQEGAGKTLQSTHQKAPPGSLPRLALSEGSGESTASSLPEILPHTEAPSCPGFGIGSPCLVPCTGNLPSSHRVLVFPPLCLQAEAQGGPFSLGLLATWTLSLLRTEPSFFQQA